MSYSLRVVPLRLTAPGPRCSAPASVRLLSSLVLVVAAPPVGRGLLVAAERRHVEDPERPHELLDPARVGGVGVVDDPVIEREGAQPRRLLPGIVRVAEVMLAAASPLLLGEGGAEVVLEVRAEG